MAVSKKEEKKDSNLEKLKELDVIAKVEALERKIAAIFQGMLEFKQDLKKIKSRMGL